jgi:hypothetical protein
MSDPADRIERGDTVMREAVRRNRIAEEQLETSSILIEILRQRQPGSAPTRAECGEAFRRHGLIEILFGAAFPIPPGGPASLRPIWADEAMSRANTMLQLVLMLDAHSGNAPQSALTLQLEHALAKHIALLFRSLDALPETVRLPCAEPMHCLLTSIVELFRPAVGELDIVVDVAPLVLPAYKRRALVLAATQIVTAAILHGFRPRKHGRIRVVLSRAQGGSSTLVVEDDACSSARYLSEATFDAIDSLARLLEAEMVCRQSELGGAAIELRFPSC